MALATQCPHCHTTFRVAHDQLKLRAGLVRCGACKQIFNGIENLLHPEDLAQDTPSAPTPAAPQSAVSSEPATSPVATEASAADVASADTQERQSGEQTHGDLPPSNSDAVINDAGITPDAANPPAAIEPAHADTSGGIDTQPSRDDPLLRMTLIDIAHVPRKPSADDVVTSADDKHGEDPVEQAIDDLQARPWRRKPGASTDGESDALDAADAADYEEPGFVRQARRRERLDRAMNIFMGTASALLLGVLIAQAAYVFRDQIAAHIPQAQPILAAACARSGCQVGLPSRVDSVSIESSELQTLAADSNTFSLTVLLRNHGSTVQAWPSIELTLNDNAEKPVVRRVFQPRDYLASTKELERGFAPASEQPLKLYFELSQLKAAGYRVYLFYP
ncbi:DUF3426 domain-containing protein [Noviherbaspirillum saxi]|uniref:DUF3426 domain-containing protein n=1 Tax=Noviherbaspirillum saxi TaxID=2320863 RepID=A0A3A3FNI2_9BURK|nr:DUF3426 domain-containing protein [Noviherbaspirillum saxi]RJF97767.1 DUF3426 domain-containing protein [Noviherbaspirillum saxi]